MGSGFCDVMNCGWYGPHAHSADGIVTGTDIEERQRLLIAEVKAEGEERLRRIGELVIENGQQATLLREARRTILQLAGWLPTSAWSEREIAVETADRIKAALPPLQREIPCHAV